IAFVTLNEEK
nr:meprin=metalloendopeptidase [mice, Peptide Partial, 10 aa] [Mus sp.]